MRLERTPSQKVLNVIRESANDNPDAVKHHKAMSRKGGKEAAKSKLLKKVVAEDNLKEAELEQAKLLSLSPEGDVLPPDPNIIASFEE